MKSYKEMAESVLNSVNEYKVRRNIRNEILRKAIPLGCLCVLLATGGIFWGTGGYKILSPANTEEESKVTSTENSEPDTYSTEAEDPLHISVSGQGDYTQWIPYRYEDGYAYFKYTRFDSIIDSENAKAKGKESVLGNMSIEEEEQWENYLDIEILLLSSAQGYFSTLGEQYKALLKREPKDGEPIFVLYRDQVDCYYDKDLLSETDDISVKDGMILKAHIVGVTPPVSSPVQSQCKWVCTMYKDGAVYYKYMFFDSPEAWSDENAVGKAKALAGMSKEEQEQWKDRLDIENMFWYVDFLSFTTVGEFYQALLERNSNYGEVDFDLYENEEHLLRDEKLYVGKNRIFTSGMILKVYISDTPQLTQPDVLPFPDDVPDILKGNGIDGINGNTTVGDLKDRLYFIDREDITVYEIELIDPDSKPIDTRHSRVMSDEQDLYDSYGIYIEYTYLDEVYAVEFYSEEIGSFRIFQRGEFALKSEFPLRM